jgi:tRNA-specific 2-thiouridylase
MNDKRVIVGMSGGVDSSVAAALLQKEGYEVIGVTIKLWAEEGSESSCCSLESINDAKKVAEQLGFKHYTVDFSDVFEREIVNNFVDEYFSGRTPNPCVICNRKIKWEELLEQADKFDARYVATGHYARVETNKEGNRFLLKNGDDFRKDQTYALWGLTQESLARTLLPLGKYTKEEIRKIAEEYNFTSANKKESMEICFISDNNYERFLKDREPERIAALTEGDIIYKEKVVGKHRGIPFYTIGQRKGLGIALGKPVYVKRIDVKNNIIEVADKEELFESVLVASKINYVSKSMLDAGERVKAKIRYSDSGSDAEILFADRNKIKIKFLSPKSAITPGQSLVVYDYEGYVLAGGIIDKVLSVV